MMKSNARGGYSQEDRRDDKRQRSGPGTPKVRPSMSEVFVNYNDLKVINAAHQFEPQEKFDIGHYNVAIRKARRVKSTDPQTGEEIVEIREREDYDRPPPGPVRWRVMKKLEQDQRERDPEFMIDVSTPTSILETLSFHNTPIRHIPNDTAHFCATQYDGSELVFKVFPCLFQPEFQVRVRRDREENDGDEFG